MLSALLRLSRKSGLYPECIILKDIVREDDCAVASGHFGEVWKGKFRDQQVCLKVVKIYKQSHVDHLLKVCSYFSCNNIDFDFNYFRFLLRKQFCGASFPIQTCFHFTEYIISKMGTEEYVWSLHG